MQKTIITLFVLGALNLVMADFALAVTKSTIEDQQNVEVTVYNSNLALIKDTRRIDMPKGVSELRFMDVAAYIQPETVHAKSLNNPNDFMVLEQNYEYDLMNPSKLLDKFVGKDIKLRTDNMYQDTTKVVTATLLSNNNNQPIYKIDGEIFLGSYGMPILPEIPDNLIAKPTLMWMVNNQAQKKNDIELSYLTNNFSWKADYVLVLDQEDKLGDLTGWVTIDNQSGATYKDAALKLVAGKVNVASRNESYRKNVMFEADMVMAQGAPAFQEKGFFEYHIYDLQRKTTLKDNQKKQINLLEAAGFNIQKEYLVYGNTTYYNRQYVEQNPKQPVNVNMIFKNSQDNKLGMPLPEGIVRLYKKDDEGKLQFIGSDNIDHTPKDEKISLKVGEAFDIVAERKQADFRQLTTRLYESQWEITLKNHKAEDVVVSLIEPVYGSWSVVSSSHDFIKEDAFTLRFDVPVKKNGEVKVQYRIRVGLE